MKKEIRFSAAIDTKEFDKSIENMQRRLQQVYQNSDQSRAQLETKMATSRVGLGAAPTAGDKARADQDDRRIRRELDKFIKDQVKEQEALSKELNKQINLRKELLKISEKDAEAKKKVVDLEKQILTNKEKQKASDEQIRAALQQREMAGFDGVGGLGGALSRAGAAYRGASMGGAGFGGRIGAAATGFMRSVASSPMVAAQLFGALGTATAVGSDVYNQFNTAERERLSLRGQATQSMTQPLMRTMGRQGFEEAMFSGERAKALQMATEEIRKQKNSDLIGLAGRLVAGGLGGAATGAAIGGISGFGIGAVPGAIIGAIGGITASGAGGEIIDRMRGVREAQYQQQIAERARQNFESMRNLNPLKQFAGETFQRESFANLPVQRMAGLSDDQMRAQLIGGASAGFTTDITRQAMSNIMSAGGSTRAAMLGTRANMLERNLGLTNATQAIGRLSALSGDDTGDAALTKILSEAFSLGLDDSNFAAENRKFVDSAVEMITRTGAMDLSTQGAMASRLAEFTTGRSMVEVSAASTAANLVSQTTATTGGARGAIQASILNRDPRFKDLNMDERNALLSMSEEQILAGGPLVEGLLEKTGMTAKDLIQTVKRPAFSTRADVDKKLEALKSAESGSQEERRLRSEVLSGMAYDNPEVLRLQPAQQDALLKGLMGKELTPEEQKLKESADERLAGRMAAGSERAGDKLIEAQAAGDKAMMDVMGAFKTDLEGAAQGAKTLAGAASEAAATIQKAYSSENFDPAKVQAAIDNLVKILNISAGQTPQGSSLIQEKGGPGGQ